MPKTPRSPSASRRAPSSLVSGRGGIELGTLLGLLSLFVTIFAFAGNCFHSDLQETRQAAKAAEIKAAKLEGELEIERQRLDSFQRAVAASSARTFAQTCDGLKGKYTSGTGICEVPGGLVLRYELPSP